MKKLLLPIILLLLGTGSGVGAAFMLREPPAPADDHAEASGDHGDASVTCPPGDGHSDTMIEPAVTIPTDTADVEYAELENQFIVPVIEDGKIAAMVVISVSIEVPAETTETIYSVEPKLRDLFLQDMFNHANIGGFSGNFTANSNMRALRTDLIRSARRIVGDLARDVLIIDIVRQDL